MTPTQESKALQVYGIESKALRTLVKDRNMVARYLSSAAFRSPASKTTRLGALGLFLAMLTVKDDAGTTGIVLPRVSAAEVYAFEWERLTRDDFLGVMTLLNDATFRMERPAGSGHYQTKPYSERSRLKILSSVRALLAYGLDQGYCSMRPATEGLLGVRVPKVGLQTARVYSRRHVEQEEISKVLSACWDDGPIGCRDSALLAFLFATGRRASEVLSLQLKDYQGPSRSADGKHPVAWLTLRTAKGISSDEATTTDQEVEIADGALVALVRWLKVRGKDPGYIFPKMHRDTGAVRPTERLARQTLANVILRRCAQAGVKPFGPHDCRRSACNRAREVNAAGAMQLLGHRTEAISASYDLGSKRRSIEGVALHMLVPIPGAGKTGGKDVHKKRKVKVRRGG